MAYFDYDAIASSVLGELTPPVQLSLRHNLAILRAVHWGAHEVCGSKLEFDPRADWWYRLERRFAVAFLTSTWKDWPANGTKHPAIEARDPQVAAALRGIAADEARPGPSRVAPPVRHGDDSACGVAADCRGPR